MVLDHLLHPNPAHIKTGDKAIRIECFEVLPSTFNSDHYGLLFSAAYGRSAQSCAVKPILEPSESCVYHICCQHGLPTLVNTGCEH